MRAARVLPLVLVAATAGAAPVTEDPAPRTRIDWSQARITAVGAGAADVRAPGPGVARIGAERRARKDAADRLLAAARALPLPDGGTVGGRIDEDAAAAARLHGALGRLRDVDVRWSSDGSVEATLALPLEAVRTAVLPPPTPRASAEAPTAVIVDASKLAASPLLGVTLAAGDERFAGPTIWTRDAKGAAQDPRVGDRPVQTAAREIESATRAIEIDLDPAVLTRARDAGALVVVIIGGNKK